MKNKLIKILIISKEKILFDDFIEYIKISDLYNNIEIYYKHISILLFIKECNLYLYKNNKKKNIYINSGFFEFFNNKISILLVDNNNIF